LAERVLITGGAGFIGSRIARRLVDSGVEVSLLDNLSRVTLDEELHGLLDRVCLIEHDLAEPIPDEILDQRHSRVYHMAAIVGAKRSAELPLRVLRTNLLATINVLDWCVRHPPDRVFFSSTSEVMDGALRVGLAEMPVSEDAPAVIPDLALPRSSYAISKQASEALVIHYSSAVGFIARIGRYHNVYGPRMGHDHVIPQFIDRILDRMDPFPMYGAYQSRAFCYVDDAVEATLQLMDVPGTEPLTVNVGNDAEQIKIIDMAERLFAVAGVSPVVDVYPPPAGSPESRLPDLRLLRELTGYEARFDLDTGLRKTYEWYRGEHSRRVPEEVVG
jgi:UDP-glucose 4-epimerase/UDP-glucuronate decarboxylase